MIEARDELLRNKQGRIYPGQVIGYRHDGAAIRLIGGGSPDDDMDVDDGADDASDADDDADDDDDSSDDGDDDSDDDADDDTTKKPAAKKAAPKPTPPAKKAAPSAKTPEGATKLERALNREREANRALRAQVKAFREKGESDAERIEREAEERATAKYKPVAVRSAVNAALREANFVGSPSRAHKLIDMEAIDVDTDASGETFVSGLEAQIAELQEEYPELFKADASTTPASSNGNGKRPAKKAAPKIDGAGKKPVEDEPKSSAERLASAFLSGRSTDE